MKRKKAGASPTAKKRLVQVKAAKTVVRKVGKGAPKPKAMAPKAKKLAGRVPNFPGKHRQPSASGVGTSTGH